jgi:hypothetical protein
MDWIKKHYDQFALALLAAGLLALCIILILRTQSFGSAFSAATAQVIPRDKVPPLELDRVDAAKKTLEKPPQWDAASAEDKEDSDAARRGSLFVSLPYLIVNNAPQKPGGGSLYKDTLTNQDIPNRWFIVNKLPLLDQNVRFQDQDKDGFNNEDEWRAHTDPNNKESHPPYYTKLFLKQFVQVPFRLIFNAYDGDVKKDKPEKFSFQINTVDLRQPSEFLKLGDPVPNTKFKLEKFEFKEKTNPSTGEKEDVSELTVVNTETQDHVVLILSKVTNSPNTFADFEYQWTQPPFVFRVAKLKEFALKPIVTDRYKLIDIKEGEAQILLPDGTTAVIKPDPRKK